MSLRAHPPAPPPPPEAQFHHPHAAGSPPSDPSPSDPSPSDPTPSSHSSPRRSSEQRPAYHLFQHRAVALTLRSAAISGQLGSGPIERTHADYSPFIAVLRTIPYSILAFQLLWSTVVTLIAYALADRQLPSLSLPFWTSRLSVSSSVSYAVGWALFVLLGFFIREASTRHWRAQLDWSKHAALLRQVARQLRQNYPPGTWHHADFSRLAAHLVAFPIALKMTLRGERERAQLANILHPADVDDVLAADLMHCHCLRVVRAYISASEDDSYGFDHIACAETPAGWGVRYLLIDLVDAVDSSANDLVSLARSSPSLGYVTHLHIFLYIWMFFLPLALVQSSGWFTILWAVLTTYGVGMLFTIGDALSDPFGYDIQDMKLNHLAGEAALQVLDACFKDALDFESVIKSDHQTPPWLESALPARDHKPARAHLLRRIFLAPFSNLSKGLLLYLLAAVAWSCFVFFFTWSVRDGNEDEECRWWCNYIPVDSSITSYVSLGIFLTLGFWLNDAYGRYWRALQLWQSKVKACVEELAFQFGILCKRGIWHERDRERLFSHLVAAGLAAKMQLRSSRDTRELEEVLGPQDVAAFNEADDFFAHAIDVVYAYLNTADCAHEQLVSLKSCPMTGTIYSVGYAIWDLEGVVHECVALRKFPISESFTTHLKIFTFFWLALLPLSLVQFAGFIGFLYVIPITYSIINLIHIGNNLSDPFGFDKEDVPLDTLCDEIRSSVHNAYHASLKGTRFFVRESEYSRDAFKAKLVEDQQPTPEEAAKSHPRFAFFKRFFDTLKAKRDDTDPSPLGSFVKAFDSLPSVSVRGMIVVIIWSVIATVISYSLSFTWSDAKRDICGAWCSPLDVQLSVLANIGFALFMILSFRASDAIGRYEEGAMFIFDMEMNLRNLAIELLQSLEENFFHRKDKERVVAHICQIPISFRDRLLRMDGNMANDSPTLLSKEDYSAMEADKDAIIHLLHTVEAYILLQDSTERDGHPELSADRASVSVTCSMASRVKKIRETISRAIGVKRFPVIASYTQHQHLFTLLWLLLLPFAMTPTTGFYTILWAPLISFGVLGLEEIAAKLVDPYGRDAIDIPFEDMCVSAASSVIQGVESINWGVTELVREEKNESAPTLGYIVQDGGVRSEYNLARFLERKKSDTRFGDQVPASFKGPEDDKVKPKFYAHLLQSVPWWVLLYVTVWTAVATIISYLARDESETVRWWKSRFAVDTTVATYVSFAAFMLLGFFVQAAFVRYIAAGGVWGSRLRSSCHTIAVHCLTLCREGTFHDGDSKRLLAHIAAIPLVLKSELRNSRDLREVKGLLSYSDIAKIQCADSMVSHCVDVIRSYYMMFMSFPQHLRVPAVLGSRTSFVKLEIRELEQVIRHSKFLRSFDIAPGFLILLNSFLGLWFLVLPFALAESSGWFTILWVPIIAYGVLGMYQIAKELQFPFGTDLNDLDLNEMANNIVSDILFVESNYTGRGTEFVRQSNIEHFWEETSGNRAVVVKRRTRISGIGTVLKLARHSFSLLQTGGIIAWTTLSVLVAWAVSRRFPFAKVVEESCGVWFCSRISISGAVQEYIGFALFLLLGFWLYESHGRYVKGTEIWSNILGHTRLLSNRVFQSYCGNEWHEKDLERFAAHLAAFPVGLMSRLRKENCRETYRKYLSEEDTEQLMKAPDPADYCLDVMHHYIIKSDDWRDAEDVVDPASYDEHWAIMWYLYLLKNSATACEELVNIPMPFGYVQHLRIFMVIWLLLLPLGLVESSGWLTILWIVFISYGVVGTAKWAEELADPFGHDISDVPIHQFAEEAAEIVRTNLHLYRNGVQAFIRDDREAFPSEHTTKEGETGVFISAEV